MNDQAKNEQFVRDLTENQNRLYGYIFSLLGDHSRASDVLQNTNLVLWRKLDEFDPLRPFLPWAFGVARFQVMAQLRDDKRDKLLLGPELAELVSHEVENQASQSDRIQAALRSCLQRLSPENRKLVEQRYFRSRKIADLADEVGRNVSAVKVALMRIRRQLAECVEHQVSVGEG